MRFSEAVKRVVIGAVTGVVYYIIYVVLLPLALSRFEQFSGTVSVVVGAAPTIGFALLMGLGIASSLLRGSVFSGVLHAISKVVGAVLLFMVLNGGYIVGSIRYGDMVISVSADITPILYVTTAVSFIVAAFDVVESVLAVPQKGLGQGIE